MKSRWRKTLLGTFVLLANNHDLEAKDYKLYFLGGQSNMDGFGRVSELPDSLQKPVSGAMIFHGNSVCDGFVAEGRGLWGVVRPGHGVEFETDGQTNLLSKWFGPELTFACRIRELQPEEHVAIIKYSRGGSSIHPEAAEEGAGCWDADYNSGNGINSIRPFSRHG